MGFGSITISPRIIAACVPREIHPTSKVDDIPPTKAPCKMSQVVEKN